MSYELALREEKFRIQIFTGLPNMKYEASPEPLHRSGRKQITSEGPFQAQKLYCVGLQADMHIMQHHHVLHGGAS